MSNSQKGASLAQQKKTIAAQCKRFEERLLKAKNDMEIVCILQEMEDMLQAEIYHWVELHETEQEKGGEGLENVAAECADQISNLESIIRTVQAQKADHLDNALRIQEVMIKTGKLKEPAIIVE